MRRTRDWAIVVASFLLTSSPAMCDNTVFSLHVGGGGVSAGGIGVLVEEVGHSMPDSVAFVSYLGPPGSSSVTLDATSHTRRSVTLFGRGFAPTLTTPTWDAFQIRVAPDSIFRVNLQFVFVSRFESNNTHAMFLEELRLLWERERVGLAIGDVREDTLSSSCSSQFRSFVCYPTSQERSGEQECDRKDLEQCVIASLHIDRDPDWNFITIVVVDSVDFGRGPSPSNGVYCSTGRADDLDLIVIGRQATTDLLAHELGHAFSLDDSDRYAELAGSNLMRRSYRDSRLDLAEGQTLRMIVDAASILNRKAWRAGTTVRCKGRGKCEAGCPPVAARVWEVGE